MAGKIMDKNKNPGPLANLKTGDVFEIRGQIFWFWPNGGFDDTVSRYAIWLGEDTPERQTHPPLRSQAHGETFTSAMGMPPGSTPMPGIKAWVMVDGAPRYLLIDANDIRELPSEDD